MSRLLFPFTLFISALLLFSIQPMIAKSLLPTYGGTPAVWTVCMLFFQMVLLVSYGYVWGLSQFRNSLYWRILHGILVVLSLLFLPLVFKATSTSGMPEWAILSGLILQIGLPVFIIGATAPLLQFAYSQTQGKGAADPYFLYSASNLGSLLSLVSYPWVLERWVGLNAQYHLWSWGYFIYLGLLAITFISFRYKPLEKIHESLEKPDFRTCLQWVYLSFVPCSLMLGVTLYISTDVAATPLFWVLPLAMYLLTFIVAFSNRPLISPQWVRRNAFFFLIFPLIGFILGANQIRAWQLILFHLVCFFMLALLAHGSLYAKRPKPQSLTLFYFCMSLGGVLAGLFNGILAPNLFNQVYEYPIAILLSLILIPGKETYKNWWVLPVIVLGLIGLHYLTNFTFRGYSSFQVLSIFALIAMVVFKQTRANLFLSVLILFTFIFVPFFQDHHILLQQRNFYGVKEVVEREGVHVLVSQSTVHGLQPSQEPKPINGFRSYYGAIKEVVGSMQKDHSSMAVTIMGLGAGTMVCQHRKQDNVKVIEIDEQVIHMARDPNLFTYLQDCPPQKVDLIQKDGRLAVEKLPDSSQNLLVLDAFNSDAIPVHLMTLEAFTLYQKKLREDGVILVNVSNRHLDMMPVLTAIARQLDYAVFSFSHHGDARLGQFDSAWALLTMNQDIAMQLMQGNKWQFMAANSEMLWTDDYSNIIPLLRFH